MNTANQYPDVYAKLLARVTTDLLISANETQGRPVFPALKPSERTVLLESAERLLADRDFLHDHIRFLQSRYQPLPNRGRPIFWGDKLLSPEQEEMVLTRGVAALGDEALAALLLNPVALHGLYDLVQEMLRPADAGSFTNCSAGESNDSAADFAAAEIGEEVNELMEALRGDDEELDREANTSANAADDDDANDEHETLFAATGNPKGWRGGPPPADERDPGTLFLALAACKPLPPDAGAADAPAALSLEEFFARIAADCLGPDGSEPPANAAEARAEIAVEWDHMQKILRVATDEHGFLRTGPHRRLQAVWRTADGAERARGFVENRFAKLQLHLAERPGADANAPSGGDANSPFDAQANPLSDAPANPPPGAPANPQPGAKAKPQPGDRLYLEYHYRPPTGGGHAFAAEVRLEFKDR